MPKYLTRTFIVLLALCLANVLIQYLSGSYVQSYLYKNADALFLSTLFSDLFSRGGHFKDWYLTPSPYFFPDYLIFLFGYLGGASAYIQIIAAALVQAIFILFAIWALARATGSGNPFIVATTALIGLMYLALNDDGPFKYILSQTFHFGTLLVAILLCALWVTLENGIDTRRRIIITSLVALLSFATALSDMIFLVQFVVPLIATQVLVYLSKRDYSMKNKIPLILVLFSTWLGATSYKWFVENQTRYQYDIGVGTISAKLVAINKLFRATMVGHPVIGFVLILYILMAAHCIIRLIQNEKDHARLNWLVVFSFFSICSTFGAVLLTTNLSAASWYQLPVLTWPVIIVCIFLGSQLRGKFVPLSLILSSLVLASVSWASFQLARVNGIKAKYYPEEISCIDKVLQANKISNGIAQYWDAKYIQMFSRAKLNLAQYDTQLTELRWITSTSYFRDSYDFAIIAEDASPPYKISADALTRLNGKPRLIETCGKRSVYVYDKDKLRTKKIVSVGDTYTWMACELPMMIGEKVANCEVQKRDNAQTGHVTFGPYDKLPAGQYLLEIMYSSSPNKDVAVGEWDIVLALPKEAKVLNSGQLVGTKGAPGVAMDKFTVPPEHDWEKFEVRTLSHPHKDLKIISLRITRVQ